MRKMFFLYSGVEIFNDYSLANKKPFNVKSWIGKMTNDRQLKSCIDSNYVHFSESEVQIYRLLSNPFLTLAK